MNAPKVSVILTSFNNAKYLGAAIDSILAQSFSDFELILVDDCSQDDSARIIKAYESRDSRVKSLLLGSNTGMSAVRNWGFDFAAGEYIAYMDSDDVSLPARLQKQVDFLEQNPETGAVGVWVSRTNHDLTIQTGIRKCPPEHAMIVYNIFNGRILQILSGTMMIRRHFLEDISGWNEEVRYNHEMGFFASLLIHASIRFANIAEILYIQREHDNNTSNLAVSEENRSSMFATRHQLRRLWGGVGDEALRCFRSLYFNEKLSWGDRRIAKKYLRRIIETLVERGYIKPEESALLLADMNRTLENASPRRWQQLCHWRRKWLGRRG